MFLDGSLFVDYLDASLCLAYDDPVSPLSTLLLLLPDDDDASWPD